MIRTRTRLPSVDKGQRAASNKQNFPVILSRGKASLIAERSVGGLEYG